MTVPLVVGNWKMNGKQAESAVLARAIVSQLETKPSNVEIAIAPPFTALPVVGMELRNSPVKLAAQNCHWEPSGAFTGEVSAPMLSEIGCQYVILGHSERRHIFHERDEMIARKISSVTAQSMRAILCVGETLDQRHGDKTVEIVTAQLDNALKGLAKGVIADLEIAYEPVWAIGTGQHATPEQVSQVHECIREYLRTGFGAVSGNAVRLLYGGSVKPENAESLAKIDQVNGFLVGGASLQAEPFLAIADAFNEN
ncbi:MAG: triose-phosphate isomerase [Deltaproteobacteria bacterium]|nr:triose-phosphate isomerase [Deltaproteobacteria bacterium]